jgi:hypothetical protein
MPYAEVLMKDVQGLFFDALAWMKNGFSLPVLVVYPDYPSKKTTIVKIARALGYRITNKRLSRARHVLWFHDTTYASSELLVQSYPDKKVLNRSCQDISKKHVDKIHQRVFGYSTIINPTNYVGSAVAKSDINALHDGEIIRCPISNPSEKAVYQIVIDNAIENGEYVDIRVPVIGGAVPLVYKKFKQESVRFTNQVHRSEMHEPNSVFSETELENIRKMAIEMGADFCEFDVLRDNHSGRIYVIDVNKTPYGPPAGLSSHESRKAVQMLTNAFAKAFEN